MGRPSPLVKVPGKLAGAQGVGSPRPPWEIKASTPATASPLARKYAATPGTPPSSPCHYTQCTLKGFHTATGVHLSANNCTRLHNGIVDVQCLSSSARLRSVHYHAVGVSLGWHRVSPGVSHGCHRGFTHGEGRRGSQGYRRGFSGAPEHWNNQPVAAHSSSTALFIPNADPAQLRL